MSLHARPGPYSVGQCEEFTCHVPRVRDDVSENSLQLTILGKTSSATILNNTDGTQRLYVRRSVCMENKLDGENVTCRFVPSHGDEQTDRLTLEVVPGKNVFISHISHVIWRHY